MQKKILVSLIAFASLLIARPSSGSDGVQIVGTAEKLQIELSNATVDDALAALRSAFDFKCRCIPSDRRVTGIYQGNLGSVLARLLERDDYIIKTSPSGNVEVIVLRTKGAPQRKPSYESPSAPTTVYGDEARGRSLSGVSRPSPRYAAPLTGSVDDESRGKKSGVPPPPN